MIHHTTKRTKIAKQMPGRIGKQCRERWCNHLDPNVKREGQDEGDPRYLAPFFLRRVTVTKKVLVKTLFFFPHLTTTYEPSPTEVGSISR